MLIMFSNTTALFKDYEVSTSSGKQVGGIDKKTHIICLLYKIFTK